MQKHELADFLENYSENRFFVVGFHRAKLENYGYFVLGEFQTEEEAEICAMPYLEMTDATKGVQLWWRRKSGEIFNYAGKVS